MEGRIPEFPERLIEFATGGFGEKGKAWLGRLPDILERCRAKWGLTLGPPVEEIKANYVGYARLPGGEEVVLKVAVPHRDFSTEMEALAIYKGRGINRLIDLDRDLNAMLLERLRPGTMLAELTDKREQTEAAARIIQGLHKTPPPSEHTLPHFMDWVEGAFGDARTCKDPDRARPYLDQIPRVQAMMEKLRLPDEPQLLLHGDLHHWNILKDKDRGWMAIDPKGVIGASCLDVGRFVNNAIDDGVSRAEKRQTVLDAVRIFSEMLGESEERMFAGAFCDKVMGSSWGLKQEPEQHEAHSQEVLSIMVEIGHDVDVSRL